MGEARAATSSSIGITAFAQEQLGDVVFVELPEVGAKLEPAQSFGVVEAVKTVSDLYAPVAGEVVEVNAALPKTPELVNQRSLRRGLDDPDQAHQRGRVGTSS